MFGMNEYLVFSGRTQRTRTSKWNHVCILCILWDIVMFMIRAVRHPRKCQPRYPAAVTDAPPAKAEEGAGHVYRFFEISWNSLNFRDKSSIFAKLQFFIFLFSLCIKMLPKFYPKVLVQPSPQERACPRITRGKSSRWSRRRWPERPEAGQCNVSMRWRVFAHPHLHHVNPFFHESISIAGFRSVYIKPPTTTTCVGQVFTFLAVTPKILLLLNKDNFIYAAMPYESCITTFGNCLPSLHWVRGAP